MNVCDIGIFKPWISSNVESWEKFCDAVASHIETYTIPQYGDYPSDQLTRFSVEDIETQITRYENRRGKRLRGIEEEKRDCLKIAHYVQVANDKRKGVEGPRMAGWRRFCDDMCANGTSEMSLVKAYAHWKSLEARQ